MLLLTVGIFRGAFFARFKLSIKVVYAKRICSGNPIRYLDYVQDASIYVVIHKGIMKVIDVRFYK